MKSKKKISLKVRTSVKAGPTELVSMMSNILKNDHDTKMSPIGNWIR